MDGITEAGVRRWLTGSFGRTLSVYEEVTSTNDIAKRLAKSGAPHGAAVLAQRQTAGRGRLGRRFYSPAGSGIYLTAIVRPEFPQKQSLLITPAAAVATARAIRRVTGIETRIKWVNDLYLDGKKLCGILTESAVGTEGRLLYAVVGIGINVTTDSFPPEVSDVATALNTVYSGNIDRERLAAAVLDELEIACGQIESRAFLGEYRQRSCVIGRRVRLLNGEQQQEVQVLGIDEDARLVVQTEEGKQLTIGTGEVSLKGNWG